MTEILFDDLAADEPDVGEVRREHEAIRSELARATAVDELAAAVRRWDDLRRRLDTWTSLVEVRFQLDTRSEERRLALQRRDEVTPKLTELDVAMMRELVAHARRAELEERLGAHAFALWQARVTTYDPAIEQDSVREAALEAEYIALCASAQLEFEGETLNLSSIAKHFQSTDRGTRHHAYGTYWSFFEQHADELDRIFDELTTVRHAMAGKLGYDDYTELGYRKMARTDYGREDVERFREEVRESVVPLNSRLAARKAERLGVDPLMVWDEPMHDAKPNPRPLGGVEWQMARAEEMFDALGGGFGDFYGLMRRRRMLDLDARDGKAAGGFCIDFPSVGMPFVFANFNGTKGDVEVFTHEMGHAFQGYQGRTQPLLEYMWPTAEACEVHSMSLEFLTWPHMERFFGDSADDFRRMHLEGALAAVAHVTMIDHFQHLVYASPDATTEERHAMWREMERTYLPERDWGDLARPAAGAGWQRVLHVYRYPFYSIDYALAQVCALQFWVRSRRDFGEALHAYVGLCKRAGEAPFQELVRSAGLVSPFERGCLAEALEEARAQLAL